MGGGGGGQGRSDSRLGACRGMESRGRESNHNRPAPRPAPRRPSVCDSMHSTAVKGQARRLVHLCRLLARLELITYILTIN